MEINRVYGEFLMEKGYRADVSLGKGGFGECYRIVDNNSEKFAAKIILKSTLENEIKIHKSLEHKNVVRFFDYFKDSYNVYIIMELCENGSMFDLIGRRGVITENETKYYIYHILEGVKYLHDKKIIHRDLKLENIFLDHNLNVKIGDFGLAIYSSGEDNRGTLDYKAPEILNKKLYSLEVDIWAIGCVMYALLVGQLPFKNEIWSMTEFNIRNCHYSLPLTVGKNAADMIGDILQLDPAKRPSAHTLSKYNFLDKVPTSLPISTLTMAPSEDQPITHKNPLRNLGGYGPCGRQIWNDIFVQEFAR